MKDYQKSTDTFTQFCKRLMEPLGAYPRRLLADYKDPSGQDFHQELVTLHPPGETDEALVESIREALAAQGYALTALLEIPEDTPPRALYLGRGYLMEYLDELGLPVPADMEAALKTAGIHPVNWEELVCGS